VLKEEVLDALLVELQQQQQKRQQKQQQVMRVREGVASNGVAGAGD
jgi:hypothetical protein